MMNSLNGLSLIERIHHIIAILPCIRPDFIEIGDAIGLRVAGDIEPVPAPLFAVLRTGKQTIDQSIVSVRRIVVGQTLRRSAGVGGKPVRSNVARRISVRLSANGFGLIPFSASIFCNERIDGIACPIRRHRRLVDRLKRPVGAFFLGDAEIVGVFGLGPGGLGPLGDPFADDRLLLLGQLLRWPFRHLIGVDFFQEETIVRLARHDRWPRIARL